MDIVDFLHKVLRTIKRGGDVAITQLQSILRVLKQGSNIAITQLQPILHVVKQVAKDAKEQLRKSVGDLQGMSHPGLPGNGQYFEEAPLINFNEPILPTTTMSNGPPTSINVSYEALPIDRTRRPNPRPTRSPQYHLHLSLNDRPYVSPRAPINHWPFYHPLFGVSRYTWPQNLQRSPIPGMPAINQHNSQARGIARPSPLPQGQSFNEHLTVTGPEIVMSNNPTLTFNETADFHQRINDHITAASHAERRMINHEISYPAPPGGLEGLRAMHGQQVRDGLEHLTEAQKIEMLLPEECM